ncbi:MAG TPA: gas vesicle protein GvpJ [Candidatus Elarobacter sp.]|nr:gas vesicle protein GvpJ [Candidatus Elarobacter sp.]
MATEDDEIETLDVGGAPGAPSVLGDEPLELVELLNTVLDKGAVVHGEVIIAVADIDLIRLNLGLLLQAVASEELRTPGVATAAGRSLAGAFGPPILDQRDREAADARQRERDRSAAAPEGQGALSGPVHAAPRETALNAVAQGLPDRINADAKGVESGLARLVLTLIEVLRKVLEHQAVRRMEGGRLTPEEVERLGLALSRVNDRMQDLKRVFGLSDEDLQIDLGPLGRLR